MAIGRFREIKALHQQTASLAEQLETRKVVDRAKGRLMDEHGQSEQDAFTFIQRTAMSRRLTMRVVAEQILDGQLVPPVADPDGSTP